jgi:hypothetical protein
VFLLTKAALQAISEGMNTQQVELWIEPDFEEISACMECTAYAETVAD